MIAFASTHEVGLPLSTNCRSLGEVFPDSPGLREAMVNQRIAQCGPCGGKYKFIFSLVRALSPPYSEESVFALAYIGRRSLNLPMGGGVLFSGKASPQVLHQYGSTSDSVRAR